MRRNNSSGKPISTIETDTVSARRAVDLNLACIWLETLGRILGGDTALDSKTTSGDAVLGKTKLCKGRTSCDLDLGCDDIDAGNFLGNCVLDLAIARSV